MMAEEELKFELRERLEDAYRLRPSAQLALYIFLELVALVTLYTLRVPLREGFIIFLFVSTVLYPVIIKVRNLYTDMIGMALYGATIFTIGLYIYDMLLTLDQVADKRIVLENVYMALIFLLVFGVELFHHVYEKAKVLKVKWAYIADIILSAIFAYIIYNLLVLWQFDFAWTLLLTAVSTLFYFIAIKPETPF